jgi:hypothetical protein
MDAGLHLLPLALYPFGGVFVCPAGSSVALHAYLFALERFVRVSRQWPTCASKQGEVERLRHPHQRVSLFC